MDEQTSALRALGLTEYGARAYAALVSLGPSAAPEVASAGPVPRTKVYAVLSELSRKGWIETEGGRPRRYRAKPPRECFARERARLDATLERALPPLEAQFRDRSRRFAGPLWILRGGALVAERGIEMVSGAKRDVLLVATFAVPGDEKALARAVRDAVRRGVRVRVAAPDLDAPHVRALAKAGAELRVAFVPPRFLAVDGAQALACFPQPQPDGSIDVVGLWNPSPELIAIVGGIIEGLWMSALPPEP